MRVIAGIYKSRALVAPTGTGTRPTSDRLRETLFNVLMHRPGFEGCIFADLFAGSGAVGIEAISRGAQHCYFVEKEPRALAALKRNLAALGIGAVEATIVADDVTAFLKKWARACDIIYLDPPYDDAEIYARVLNQLGSRASAKCLRPGALVLAEHAAPKTRKGLAEPGNAYGGLQRVRLLEQSDAALSFFELQEGTQVKP